MESGARCVMTPGITGMLRSSALCSASAPGKYSKNSITATVGTCNDFKTYLTKAIDDCTGI